MEQFNLALNSDKPNTLAQYIEQLKNNQEDFEWYPTTDNMIQSVIDDINTKYHRYSRITRILDIGAGDGRVLNVFRKNNIGNTYLAIEKAVTHTRFYPEHITLVGTDFYQTTLIDKSSDVIFCNPPYSDYENWVASILSNGFATVFYFVIPERWENNAIIQQTLSKGEFVHEILMEDDFLSADRKARAKINVVRFVRTRNIKDGLIYTERGDNDPFSDWFTETFPELSSLENDSSDIDTEERKRTNEIFLKTNKIDELVAFYNKDMERIYSNYRKIATLDHSLFKELNLSLKQIQSSLREKMDGLRNQYWNNFIHNYKPITARLTSSMRDRIYNTIIGKATTLDFTVLNAYAITERLIEISNSYVEEQLKEFYNRLSTSDNIVNYKSNQRVFSQNRWRYNNKEDFSHYKLDYRIISTGHSDAISWNGDSLHNYVLFQQLNDIAIIAKSLGFNVNMYTIDKLGGHVHDYYRTGDKIDIFYQDLSKGSSELLFSVKFFKNGNRHLSMCKELALRLNVMAGKLFGWVRSAAEFADETDFDVKDVQRVFNIDKTTRIEQKTAFAMLGYEE